MGKDLPRSTPLVSTAAQALEAYTHVVNALERQERISLSQRSGLKTLETTIEDAIRVEMRGLHKRMDRILNREYTEGGVKR